MDSPQPQPCTSDLICCLLLCRACASLNYLPACCLARSGRRSEKVQRFWISPISNVSLSCTDIDMLTCYLLPIINVRPRYITIIVLMIQYSHPSSSPSSLPTTGAGDGSVVCCGSLPFDSMLLLVYGLSCRPMFFTNLLDRAIAR